MCSDGSLWLVPSIMCGHVCLSGDYYVWCVFFRVLFTFANDLASGKGLRNFDDQSFVGECLVWVGVFVVLIYKIVIEKKIV